MRPRRHLSSLGLALAGALLVGATASHAALTTDVCLAKKSQVRGKLTQCLATEDAKALQGKPADFGKCGTKFQEKVAQLNDKAGDTGIECRYVDNGDGTVTDYDTGLQWEKKDNLNGGTNFADPHDADNIYSWGNVSGCGTAGCPNGTAFTDFLGRLNTCGTPIGIGFSTFGFANHCDWRLPTLSELLTIRQAPCETSACIDPIFGPTDVAAYWASTSNVADVDRAWSVAFSFGSTPTNGTTFKNSAAIAVRAVRGGS